MTNKTQTTLCSLYSKTSSGKLQEWQVTVDGDEISVTHGQVGGKKQTKVTKAKPKNVGRANETTADQQALLEARSKWQHQLDRGYFKTPEEALSYRDQTPMKAQNYNDQAHKIVYPCYVQPKLNGMRLKVSKASHEDGALTKAGLTTHYPEHWHTGMRILEAHGLLDYPLDGEVYAGIQINGGLSLQQIISAYRKPNGDTQFLNYFIYDVDMPGATFEQRTQQLMKLHDKLLRLEVEGITLPFVVVATGIANNEQEGDVIYKTFVEMGYEGIMYRNAKGEYECGKRSYDLIKRKPRQTTEAKVLTCTQDKNNEGVLTVELQDGTHFDLKMRKDSHPVINYRGFVEACTLVGQFVELEYEELSDDGVPTKPVGIGLRKVDPITWEVLE